jgi:AAA15 family ATPase/GTPase
MRSGIISKDDVEILNIAEKILNDFFTQAYADIKRISYEKKSYKNNSVKYQLYVDKMIAGKIRRINFEHESAGTQQILEIVRMLLGLFCGVTVVYDEIDDGIHDVLLCNIISSLKNEINGQLIITTHNTMLLEEIDPRSAYVICVDYLGNKEIRCMADFSIQNSNNARIKYLKGLFGGTPYIEGIDYDTIVYEIEGKKEES